MVKVPKTKPPKADLTVGTYIDIRIDTVNMAMQAMQRQIDTITAAHNTLVDRVDAIKSALSNKQYKSAFYSKIRKMQDMQRAPTHDMPEVEYYSFVAAMKAYTEGKKIKRAGEMSWTYCPKHSNLFVNIESILATDWMILDA